MKYHLLIAAVALFPASSVVAAPHEGSAFLRDYDADHDSQLTRAEFDAGRSARFGKTDVNGDGWVSENEYVGEYSQRLEAELAASTSTDADKLEDRQRQIRQAHVRFGVLDRNKDAKLQKVEYDASGARAFAGQDDNKDDIITAADTAAISARQTAENARKSQ